ncbi:ABC transporter, permease protein [Leptospira broomii serovar Hurstbridge str. 5399]|uniref:ABC transporter, permease protein n=1 Tax=Leptospira broomii serovar Hurstbridge str. 5399 TaxID=1049789 RepID=T0GKB5_9LEPT|nr:ABC transporter permease subunit [Leptospira broomii]EQA45823.1 ABC transporter, permease protein [Leptospira broomii serovar Hurstbridge str. 5399]
MKFSDSVRYAIIGSFLTIALGGILLHSPPTQVELHDSFRSISAGAPLGKDRLGRDVWAMLGYGSLSTFLFAFPARVLTLLFASLLGLLAYSSPFLQKNLLSPLSSVFVSIPSLLLALLVIQAFGATAASLFIAILLGDWAPAYETLRTRIEEVRGSGYVLAASCFGAGKTYIFRSHILPQAFQLLGILLTTGLPSVVMTLAIFGFLGISAGGDTFGPGLGEQIAFSKDYAESAPWALIVPILGILGLVYSVGGRKN